MGRVLAVIIWILTLLSVLLFVSGKWWFPAAISEHAPALDRQFMITIVVVGLAFTAAQIGLGWMVWKYRDTGASADRAIYTYGGKDNKFGRTDPKFIDDGSLNFIGLDANDAGSADDAVISSLVIPVGRPV